LTWRAGRSPARRLFGALLALFLALPAARAQADRDAAREREIAATAEDLRAWSEDLRDGVADPEAFERKLRGLIAAARAELGPVETALNRAEDGLAALGPAPKEGEAPESPAIAAERAAFNRQIALLRGQRTRILANIDSATELLGEMSERRLRDRYREILKREAPLTAPSLWLRTADEASALSAKIGGYFDSWTEARGRDGEGALSVALMAAAFVASLLMFGPLRDWMRRAFTARIEAQEPTPTRRVASAGVTMLSRLIPGVVGGLVLIESARALGLLAAEGAGVARAFWGALIAFLLVDGFAAGLFAPTAPAWRPPGVEAAKGKRVTGLLLALVLVIGTKSVLNAVAQAAGEAPSLMRAAAGVAALLAGGLLFALCDGRIWRPAEPQGRVGAWPAVRLAGRALAVFIIAAALAGHVNLADFLATRLFYLALLLAVAWFLRAALKEATAYADRRLHFGRPAEDGQHAFRFWIGAGIDLALLFLLIPALLLLAGVEPSAVRTALLRAMIGFRVGGVVISFGDILLAIAAFIGILLLTRVLQGLLQRGPLREARVDSGVKDSLTTLLGYAGLAIAAFAAFGFLGVDFSNLALIFGALSVGIGFGLQAIVNNFVSGLILLFERPIKVGDWIVTNSGEGIVKKISVRSTEIETFDRSTIIIPNSELVASTVTNWTHKSTLGRIIVPVGVAYDSDPDLVKRLLLECAHEHPLVVRYPEPFVVWMDFGASSLDFELRAFLSDISKGLHTRSDLRAAIFRKFKENGVEIPFPQQDVYIKTAAPAARALKPPRPAASPAPPPHEAEDADAADD
jgi:small-conductance mechanosensitive channel